MKVISLSALRPQSGKDTLCSMFKNALFRSDVSVASIAFAGKLREEVSQLFPTCPYPQETLMLMLNCGSKDVDSEHFAISKVEPQGSYYWFLVNRFNADIDEIEKPRSLRFHMQVYGNDFIKGHLNIDNYYVANVKATLKRFESFCEYDYVVITDTRSPQELEMLKKDFLAKTFLITREGFPKDNHDDISKAHPIERMAKDLEYDHILQNTYGQKKKLLADFLHILNVTA